MLAVWQKRFCKVKDQTLQCYRNADENEKPALVVQLPGYKLDLADETWKSNSFKIYKTPTDALFFATETREELIKWLNILAKEVNKERFQKQSEKPDIPVSENSHIKALIQQMSEQSTEDTASSGSTDNLTQIKIDPAALKAERSSHEFDADQESADSEDIVELNHKDDRFPTQKHKHLRVPRKGRRRARSDSFDDPEADMQGYLYRKFASHWSRRWCCVKEGKFFSYKRSPRETAELVVLLPFAAISYPPQGEGETTEEYNLFKLRYEGDNSVVFSTAFKEDWENWTRMICEHIGSQSEEHFPYINVPPLSTAHSLSRDKILGEDSQAFDPEAISTPMEERKTGHAAVDHRSSGEQYYVPIVYGSQTNPRKQYDQPNHKNHQFLDQPNPNTQQYADQYLERTPDEIEKALYSGILTELQMLNQTVRHAERFMVITSEKWLKFYEVKYIVFDFF